MAVVVTAVLGLFIVGEIRKDLSRSNTLMTVVIGLVLVLMVINIHAER